MMRGLRRLWGREKVAYGLRVLIALSGVMGGCWLFGRIDLLIPLFLGVIAAALAETDEGWRGRLKAILITLPLFAVSALVVEGLTPYPLAFVIGIAVSTFGFSLLGGLGERYATIAQATLILAVYTMLGLEQQAAAPGDPWHEPLLLTLGAAWYGLLSVLWQAVFAHHPVQQGLARLFEHLAAYLEAKAALFEPSCQLDSDAARLVLARRNGAVVIALNQVKELIRTRVRGPRFGSALDHALALFFLAQDIHERASSSHYPYEDFARAFFHSDVLFRCQRLLLRQGEACRALGRAIRLGEPFDASDSGQTLADLRESFANLSARIEPEARPLLGPLGALVGNLTALDAALAAARTPETLPCVLDRSLFDASPRTPREAWRRLRREISPASPVFRHALRLSLALSAGYGLKLTVHPSMGYWILLTTLFVCQPNYASTRRRLGERVAGTMLGLVAGWALITLFPAPEVQRLLAVVAGVAFFVWRSNRYLLATGAITVMVVCCFNQVVDGYAILWPRLIDTLIGSLLSGLAVICVLPDWQGRQLHKEVAATLRGNAGYLREILRQYAVGKRDDLAYRLARRGAHAADAALSTTLSNMLVEPGRFRRQADAGLRVLVLSHTLLGHLSALGAQRGDGPSPLADDPALPVARAVADGLEALAADLEARRPILPTAAPLPLVPDTDDDRRRLLRTQVGLIRRQLDQLRALAGQVQ